MAENDKEGRAVHRRLFPGMAEAVFDVLYLLFAVGAGAILVFRAFSNALDGADYLYRTLEVERLAVFGAACLVLGLGDAFHLVPRVLGNVTGTMESRVRELGRGRQITSITMTLFYVLLYWFWSRYLYTMPPVVVNLFFVGDPPPVWCDAIVFALAAVRIVLCFFPQNGWTSKNPPLSWSIARNVPFLLLGLMVAVCFASGGPETYSGYFFGAMPIAIVLSFAFYLPVVLGAKKFPKLGMLMLPKTCAYVWIIIMGLSYLL